MRITYVARSFLDYRIPVFAELDRQLPGKFKLIYNADYVPERVHIKVMDVLGDRAVGLRGEKRIGPNEFPGFANSAVRIVYQPGLLAEIDKTKPDVIVGDGFFQWTSFALLYKIMKGTPLVVCYERTSHTERYAQWYRRAYRRLALKCVDAVCCNGRLCSEYTQWLGMPESRITTGHMVADTENLGVAVASIPAEKREALRKQWDNQETVFLAVGILNKRKGIKELLTGWSLFEKELPNKGTLVIIGDGQEKDSLQFLVADLDLKEVRFLGTVDYNEIALYYAASDVFIMPTLEDNWSLVVPEAMACGLPVLCSKYNGCYPELIRPGENGWVFDPFDAQEIFQLLKKCTIEQQKSNLQNMGKRSKEIVSEHSPQSAAQAIYDACEIALA